MKKIEIHGFISNKNDMSILMNKLHALCDDSIVSNISKTQPSLCYFHEIVDVFAVQFVPTFMSSGLASSRASSGGSTGGPASGALQSGGGSTGSMGSGSTASASISSDVEKKLVENKEIRVINREETYPVATSQVVNKYSSISKSFLDKSSTLTKDFERNQSYDNISDASLIDGSWFFNDNQVARFAFDNPAPNDDENEDIEGNSNGNKSASWYKGSRNALENGQWKIEYNRYGNEDDTLFSIKEFDIANAKTNPSYLMRAIGADAKFFFIRSGKCLRLKNNVVVELFHVGPNDFSSNSQNQQENEGINEKRSRAPTQAANSRPSKKYKTNLFALDQTAKNMPDRSRGGGLSSTSGSSTASASLGSQSALQPPLSRNIKRPFIGASQNDQPICLITLSVTNGNEKDESEQKLLLKTLMTLLEPEFVVIKNKV